MQKRVLLLGIMAVVILSAAAYAADEDGDTYCDALGDGCPDELDCNDNNPSINPGAAEIPGDGVDNDCNGLIDDICVDADNDGYNSTDEALCGGTANLDCDDSDMFVNPSMAELCANGVDDNCNGQTDGADSGCAAAEEEPSTCEIHAELMSWLDCDVNNINSANEGDTTYMVVFAEGCDLNSNVIFKVYEYSEGEETLKDTVNADEGELFRDIPDEDGNPSDIDAWIVPWVATYIEDDDDTAPEYYFTIQITEPGRTDFQSADSGKTEDTLLAVAACPADNPECGIECTLNTDGFMSDGTGGGGVGAINPPCQAQVDCTGAPWSSCDAETNMMTRDTSLCTVTGPGTVECIESAKNLYPAEKSCSTSLNPENKLSGFGAAECGDEVCDEGEEESCPDDCPIEEVTSSSPWLWIILAIIAAGAATGGIIYAVKKKKAATKPGQKPEEKKEQSPFTAQKDLDAVMGYIRAAKTKGYNDAQITEALKKSGWKDEQIKYAVEKMKSPSAAAAKPAVQPAQNATGAQQPQKPAQPATAKK